MCTMAGAGGAIVCEREKRECEGDCGTAAEGHAGHWGGPSKGPCYTSYYTSRSPYSGRTVNLIHSFIHSCL
jgi:hypothetical protein